MHTYSFHPLFSYPSFLYNIKEITVQQMYIIVRYGIVIISDWIGLSWLQTNLINSVRFVLKKTKALNVENYSFNHINFMPRFEYWVSYIFCPILMMAYKSWNWFMGHTVAAKNPIISLLTLNSVFLSKSAINVFIVWITFERFFLLD